MNESFAHASGRSRQGSVASNGTTGSKHNHVFVLRDADALGIDFGDYSDGFVQSMTLPGVGGIFPKDRLLQSSKKKFADSLLAEFLASHSTSVSFKVVEQQQVDALRISNEVRHNWKRAAALCERQKYLEAAALYSLSAEFNPLSGANLVSALELGGELDQAILQCKRLVERWPQWEMGYCRHFALLLQRQDVHGAIRTMAQGLKQAPNSLCILQRLARMLRSDEQEHGLVCLLDAEEGFALSLSLNMHALNLESRATLKLVSTFHILIPLHSRIAAINGMCIPPGGGLREEYDPDVYLISWECGGGASSSAITLPTQDVVAASLEFEPNRQQQQQAPTSKDTVLVFGSGMAECNKHVYHPQGLRNERAWFENAAGFSLSYEQAASGLCGWVIGRYKQDICFVLKPGEEPLGSGGEWISAAAEEEGGGDGGLSPPLYVGMNNNQRAWSASAIVQWLENGGGGRSENEIMDHLVALKGQAIQLFEGGWYEESIALLDVALTYKAWARNDFAYECNYWRNEAELETKLFVEAAKELELEEAAQAANHSVMERIVFHLTELSTAQVFEFKFESDLLIMTAKADKRQLWFCCCSPPPPPPSDAAMLPQSFQPNEIDLHFEEAEGLRITQLTSGEKQLFTLPPPPVVKLLHAWKQLDKKNGSTEKDL